MIREEKFNHTLYAIHKILVQARFMAYNKEPHKDITLLLDYAEILPRFLASEEDETEEFLKYLEAIAGDFPSLSYIAQSFREQTLLKQVVK